MSDSTTPTVDLTGLPPQQAYALGQLIHDLLADARKDGRRQGRLDAAKEIAAEADLKNWGAGTPYDTGLANGMLRAANLIVRDLAHPMTPTTEAATCGSRGETP